MTIPALTFLILILQVTKGWLSEGLADIFVKGQMVNIFSFADHAVSAGTAQLPVRESGQTARK